VSSDSPRCSDTSAERGEPIDGTASVVRSWLLLEHPGPWGTDAFADARLPAGFGPELAARCAAARVRPLLIRRVSGPSDSTTTCLAIRSGPEPPWIEGSRLDRIEDALALDLEGLGRGERPCLEPRPDPVFLVCTHGRHDRCCAERGRPLARAIAGAFPDATWECSHIGGDRFAGNVVAFPHGLYFGRVEPDEGERVARAYLEGRISLEHLRGRSCHPMPVQAAEIELRRQTGLSGVDDVAVESFAHAGREVVAVLRAGSERVQVRVRVERTDPAVLTCRSATAEPAPTYRVAVGDRA
jgi:hypothetical protein